MKSFNSDMALPGFHQQQSSSIPNVNAQPQLVEHVQAFIGRELQACREALTAAQDAFMTNFMATLEARLEANNSRQNDSATNLGDLEQHVRKLEGNLNEMELRLSKVAGIQLSKHAEHQLFETQVVSFFEMFEESLRGLRQGTSSSELQLASIARCKPAEHHNAVESILQGSGCQLRTLAKRSPAAPLVATGRCNQVSTVTTHAQMTSPSPECGETQQESGCSTPWTGAWTSETSLRVEALEAALASMQQEEQERICRLQEKIRDLQKS